MLRFIIYSFSPFTRRLRLWHTRTMPYWFDGNNLIGQSAAAAGADARTRREFLSTLASYRQAGGGKFLVFFDGDDPHRSASPPGVPVRYTAPLPADDAILEGLRGARNPAEIIVVTNDRGLAARCRDEGAQVLNWSGFHSKMSRRNRRPGRPEAQEKIDIDDWMRYFNLRTDD